MYRGQYCFLSQKYTHLIHWLHRYEYINFWLLINLLKKSFLRSFLRFQSFGKPPAITAPFLSSGTEVVLSHIKNSFRNSSRLFKSFKSGGTISYIITFMVHRSLHLSLLPMMNRYLKHNHILDPQIRSNTLRYIRHYHWAGSISNLYVHPSNRPTEFMNSTLLWKWKMPSILLETFTLRSVFGILLWIQAVTLSLSKTSTFLKQH